MDSGEFVYHSALIIDSRTVDLHYNKSAWLGQLMIQSITRSEVDETMGKIKSGYDPKNRTVKMPVCLDRKMEVMDALRDYGKFLLEEKRRKEAEAARETAGDDADAAGKTAGEPETKE